MPLSQDDTLLTQVSLSESV